jgi:phage terminase small subunit
LKQLKRAVFSLSELTEQQYLFIEEYLSDPSSRTKAAIRAGYVPSNASAAASHLMKNPRIKEIIEDRQKERAHRLGINEDRVLKELRNIAFANLKEIMELNEEGETTINLDKLDTDSASALGEVSISSKGGKVKVKTTKVRLHDKLAALEKLGKHLGMFKDKIEHTGTLTLEQLVTQSMEEKE